MKAADLWILIDLFEKVNTVEQERFQEIKVFTKALDKCDELCMGCKVRQGEK